MTPLLTLLSSLPLSLLSWPSSVWTLLDTPGHALPLIYNKLCFQPIPRSGHVLVVSIQGKAVIRIYYVHKKQKQKLFSIKGKKSQNKMATTKNSVCVGGKSGQGHTERGFPFLPFLAHPSCLVVVECVQQRETKTHNLARTSGRSRPNCQGDSLKERYSRSFFKGLTSLSTKSCSCEEDVTTDKKPESWRTNL